jgi:hypothetical protein
MRDLVAERLYDTPDRVFETRMRHIAHAESLFAGSISTRANVASAVRISARHSWRALMSKHEGELVSVRIIPNERGKPLGTLANAEVVFAPHAGPLSGLTLIGRAVWERREGGRSVTCPVRQYSVNGVRRNFLLLRSSNRTLEAQEPLRQYILDAYSRLEECA